MEYQCVKARFYFWDMKKGYTVEYTYGVSTWYVFEDEKDRGALWWKKIDPKKSKTPNRIEAMNILSEYLETLTVSK